MLLYLFNAILQSQGDTKSFRNVLIFTSVLNLGLDPWFIYGGFGLPAMGLAGVAWATILLQALGAVYLLRKARRTGLMQTNRGTQPDPSTRECTAKLPARVFRRPSIS